MIARPTRRAYIIVGIGLLLVLAGATAQAGWLFVLAAGVLAIVVASLFTAVGTRSVTISQRVPHRARVGDDVATGMTVSNGGRRWLPTAIVEDSSGAFDPAVVAHDPIPPGRSAHLELVRTARRRGVFSESRVMWRTAAPFGLARASRALHVPTETTIVPRWVDLAGFPILEPSSFPSDVLHERARTGAGEEYLGVRDYRPGDPVKTIHWRSTARAGHLIVREYEQEASVRVGVALAGRDLGELPDSSFEMLVSAVASVGIYALITGHPVDAVRAHGEGVDHVGSVDRGGLLDWLAAAVPTDASLVGSVGALLSRVGRRGTIVLFAPDSGAAGASIDAAARMVQSVGARAIAVVARGATWGAGPGELEEPPERVPVRWLEQGKDLARCLQG